MPTPNLLIDHVENVGDPIPLLNDRLNKFDYSLAGRLRLDVSAVSTPYTLDLTTASNRATRYEFHGTRASALTIIIGPQASRRFSVENESTTQPITVKVTSGGVGVTVPNGATVLMEHDDTNVYQLSSSSPLLTSLISYWALDETSGTRLDSHGSNHLTDNNTVTQNTGKIGNAAQFTSANSEFLSVADNALLSTGDIDFTIAGWVYFDTISVDRPVAGKWLTAGNREYIVQLDGTVNKIRLYVSNDGTATANVASSVVCTTATWYYFVAWHDSAGNTINIQVNNGTVDSTAHSTGVRDGTAGLRLGNNQNTGTDYMNGRIDGLGFWKRILTSAERTNLYNSGSGLAYPFN